MGIFHSKGKNRNLKGSRSLDNITSEYRDEVGVISRNQYDEVQISIMRRELDQTPQVFFLNCLLMSVMFFGNNEIERVNFLNVSRTTLHKEKSDETIECVIPDDILEQVSKNVKFTPVHGPKKGKPQALVPKRFYVINDNVEVLESIDSNQYAVIDKPPYQVRFEETKKKGFLRLQLIEKQNKEIKSDKIVEPKPGPSTQPDEIYEYSTITDINTPKPFDISEIKNERRNTLPNSCFAVRKVKKFARNDSDSESDYDDEPGDKDEMYDEIAYVTSAGFMTYFKESLLANSLKALGINTETLRTAAIPGKIFCNDDVDDDEDDYLPCEIIPSLTIQYPARVAFEFDKRGRRARMNDRFGNIYEFPTEIMVAEIKKLNCVLIPRGFFPKKGHNPDEEIEWEIAFPMAERYLDSRMTQAQIIIFLILLTIFKTYIEPKTRQQGLLVEHIRHFVYGECEVNPRDWPHHRLGTKLLKVLDNFRNCLAINHLPNFFIGYKNMFENVPNKYLNHANWIFHRINESPAIYMVGAFRNLSYTSQAGFPKLDFDELIKILTIKDTLKLVHDTPLLIPPNVRNRVRREKPRGDSEFIKDTNWRRKMEQKTREKILKEKQDEEEKRKEENLKLTRKGSVDSVDLEWQCEKQFEPIKKEKLLTFFAKHFVEIAKKSRRTNIDQSLLYLKQAYYLAKILQMENFQTDGRDLLEVIRKEEMICKRRSVTEAVDLPPSTPKRNSSSAWDFVQHVKGSQVHLNNLNDTYQSTGVSTGVGNNVNNLKKSRVSFAGNGVANKEHRKSGARKSVVFTDS